MSGQQEADAKWLAGWRSRRYLIQPADVPVDRPYWSAFGNRETEVSALWLVRFCRDRLGHWGPFPLHELQAYYAEQRAQTSLPAPECFSFNNLLKLGYVKLEPSLIGEHVVLSDLFVDRCWAATAYLRRPTLAAYPISP